MVPHRHRDDFRNHATQQHLSRMERRFETTRISKCIRTNDERDAILAQFNNLAAVPNYPGSYYLARYVNFAFLAAYNESKDPADSLLSYVTVINKEITRRRIEFGMDYIDTSTGEKVIVGK